MNVCTLRDMKDKVPLGLKSLRKNDHHDRVPQGRLNLAQDAVLG
jgi:hypothetical protein